MVNSNMYPDLKLEHFFASDYYHKLPSISVIKFLYVEKKLSTIEIAKRYNVTHAAVRMKLKRYGIDRRSLPPVKKLDITQDFENYLNGLLLGDGCIVFSRNGKTASYKHGDSFPSYIEWLGNKLQEFGLELVNNCRPHFLITRCYKELAVFRRIWYPNDKKKIPTQLELTPQTLKQWYIGDGSYLKGINGTKKSEQVIICSEFDPGGKERLARQLTDLGIENSVYKTKIYIKAKSRPHFFEYILSEDSIVSDCYKYKFPKELV